MEEKGMKNFKKLVTDFRVLTTKVQKDNPKKTKNLKKTTQVLEAFKSECQKLYLEHENKKKQKNKNEEQQEELLKYRNHCKNQTTSKASIPQLVFYNIAISSLTQ